MPDMPDHNIAIQDAEKWAARGPLPSLHIAKAGASRLHLLTCQMNHTKFAYYLLGTALSNADLGVDPSY